MFKTITTTIIAIVIGTTAFATNTTQYGDWNVVTKHDPISNQSQKYIYTRSQEGESKYGDKGYLGFNCSSAYINVKGVVLNSTRSKYSRRTTLQNRYDNEDKARTGSWNVVKGNGGAYSATNQRFWNNDKAFLNNTKRSRAANYGWFQVDAYGQLPINYKFSMIGFTAAITELREHCRTN